EHAARADLSERPSPVAVARGRDRHEGDLDARAADRGGRLLRLGQREPRAARPDTNEHSATSLPAVNGRTTGTPAGHAGTRWERARAAAARCVSARPSRAL